MSGGHTPGPWDCDTDSGNIHDGGEQLASAWVPRHRDNSVTERAANARLIAAAPDGYALAELAMELIDGAALVERDHPQASLKPLRLAAEAFLAKARGIV